MERKLRIATVLFTYNRWNHTRRVLEGLKNNYVLPEKLFVFQDGVRYPAELDEWRKVNHLIHEISFCQTEVIVASENQGLAKSIVNGIDFVFHEYDAVIVLEDDCVPTPNFINFMVQCFNKYKDYKEVYNVTGYALPISIEPDGNDIYFAGRSSSWGWGTWKDRWDIYEKRYDFLDEFKSDCEASAWLSAWGSDFEQMLTDNIRWRNDSWAIYWGLGIMKRRGLCVYPYKSFINNIGMDGTGVHCGITSKFDVPLESEPCKLYTLPDKASVSLREIKAFAPLCGSYTVANYNEKAEHVIVYGIGNEFQIHEKEINERYFIELFVDQRKYGFFAGKEIHKSGVLMGIKLRVLIMVHDQHEKLKVASMLRERFHVPSENILLQLNSVR